GGGGGPGRGGGGGGGTYQVKPGGGGGNKMTTTQKVAEFVAGLDHGRIPASAIDWAKSGILDSVGVALAGSHETPGRIAAELARDESEKNEAALFGHGVRSSSTLAAFANGTASHAMDFDASFVMMGQPMA